MKILICDNLDEPSIARLKKAGLDVSIKTGMDEAELIQTIPAFDVAVVRGATKITAKVIDAGVNLKLIARAGVGLDNIDREYAQTKGIKVRAALTATTTSVAEYTIGLMLALARNIPQAHTDLKNGKWERKKYNKIGTELAGKTLGIIGFGNIGREVARRAEVFGMSVVGYDSDPAKRNCALDELLRTSDYVSLHLPLTRETKHFFDAAMIAKMKKGARLINCSRGGIVDEEALCGALREGHLAGAAIDVFENEPISEEDPLLSLDNVIAAPHIGAGTIEGQARACMEITDTIISSVSSKATL